MMSWCIIASDVISPPERLPPDHRPSWSPSRRRNRPRPSACSPCHTHFWTPFSSERERGREGGREGDRETGGFFYTYMYVHDYQREKTMNCWYVLHCRFKMTIDIHVWTLKIYLNSSGASTKFNVSTILLCTSVSVKRLSHCREEEKRKYHTQFSSVDWTEMEDTNTPRENGETPGLESS